MGGSYRLRKPRNAKFRTAYAQRDPRGLLSTYRRRPTRSLPKQRNPFAAYPRTNWDDAVDNKRADPFSAVEHSWKKVKKDYPNPYKRKVSQTEQRSEDFLRRHPRLTKALTLAAAYGVEPVVGTYADKANQVMQAMHRYQNKKR